MATHSDLRTTKPTSLYSSSSSQRSSLGTPSQQNLIAAIAYLGGPVTGIAILLLEKYNPYIRFHAMQSTVLFGFVFIANVAIGFLPLGAFGFLFGQLLTMVAFIVWIVLLYKAFNGETYEVPYIGPLSRRQLSRL
jgi:uncharacterized membrane protein